MTYEQIVEEIKQFHMAIEHNHIDVERNKDHIVAMSGDPEINTTAKYLASFNADSVIDIGCGRNPYKEKVPNLIGFDIRDDVKGPDYVKSLKQIYTEKIIQEGSVDLAYASAVMLCMGPRSHIEKNLSYISKLLKPGGFFFTKLHRAYMLNSVPNAHRLVQDEMIITENTPLGTWIRGFKIGSTRDVGDFVGTLYTYKWSEDDIDQLSSKYNLRVEKVCDFNKDHEGKRRTAVLFRKNHA